MLEDAPDAFHMHLEDEAAEPPEFWADRARSAAIGDRFATFVAVQNRDQISDAIDSAGDQVASLFSGKASPSQPSAPQLAVAFAPHPIGAGETGAAAPASGDVTAMEQAY